MIFSIPYILLICFYGFLGLLSDNTKNDLLRRRYIGLSLAVTVFFFGFRGFCFYDWNVYYIEFLHFTPIDMFKLPIHDWPFEPGFCLLMALSKMIYNNYHFFVLICTIINTILLFRFLCKYVNNIPLALMICISMNGLTLFTDLMRNIISILLFANAIEYIGQRKWLPYFSVCFAAMMFHTSALIYFPIYFILHLRLNRWVYLVIFIVGNIVYLLHISIFLSLVEIISGFISPEFQNKIDDYMQLLPDAGFKLSIGYIERLFTGILVFCFYEKLRNIRSKNDLFINSLLIYFALFFYFSEFKVISLRLSYLFSIGYWIIWIDLISCFAIRNNKRLFLVFLYLYCIFKMYGLTNYEIARYDNILFGATPYHIRSYIYNKTYNEVK